MPREPDAGDMGMPATPSTPLISTLAHKRACEARSAAINDAMRPQPMTPAEMVGNSSGDGADGN